MAVHEEVLRAANEVSDERGRFRVDMVVQRLRHLNPSTVRTHVTSRCCVNAPSHHGSRLPYFRRMGRGEYEVLERYRTSLKSRVRGAPRSAGADVKEERKKTGSSAPPLDAIHALITRSEGWYTAECLEIAAVTQGRTLDETVENLREAIALHLAGSTAAGEAPRLALSMELPLAV